MSKTINMDLDLQTPLTTQGPTWATVINENFEAIDEHDHTTGKGKTLTQASVTITGNYDFNSFRIVDAEGIQLESQSSAPSGTGDANGIYSVEGDLYWCNGSGTAVKLTSGSGINIASTGTIGGDYGQPGVNASATYSDVTKTFSWVQASGVAAKMATGSLIMYHESAGALGVTMAAKAATTAYTISFPVAAPSTATQVRVYDAAGDSIFKTVAVSGTNLALTETAGALTFSFPASPSFSTVTATGLSLTGFSGVLKASGGTISASTIVNADINASAAIADTKLATISTAGKVSNSATTATTAKSGSTIALRNGDGSLSAAGFECVGYTVSASSVNANGGAVQGGYLYSSGNLDVDGGIVAGSGNVRVKMKRLTGSASVASLGTTTQAHGVSNIIAVIGNGTHTSSGATTLVLPHNYIQVQSFDGTNITIRNGVSATHTLTWDLLIVYRV